MDNELLPIGTVVVVKDAKKMIVISGFKVKPDKNSNQIYDYIGYPYPEGFISKDFNLVFNHKDIDKICYSGYTNEEEKKFKQALLDYFNK